MLTLSDNQKIEQQVCKIYPNQKWFKIIYCNIKIFVMLSVFNNLMLFFWKNKIWWNWLKLWNDFPVVKSDQDDILFHKVFRSINGPTAWSTKIIIKVYHEVRNFVCIFLIKRKKYAANLYKLTLLYTHYYEIRWHYPIPDVATTMDKNHNRQLALTEKTVLNCTITGKLNILFCFFYFWT
jgi:hypothetical protein